MFKPITVPEDWIRLASKVDREVFRKLLPKFEEIGSGKDVSRKLKILFQTNLGSEDLTLLKKVGTFYVDQIKESTLAEADEKKLKDILIGSTPKGRLYRILVGAILVLAAYLTILYKKRKEQFGELYSIKDLLGEVFKSVASALGAAVNQVLKKVVQIVVAAFAAVILIFIIDNLIPSSWLEKYPTLRHIVDIIKDTIKHGKHQEREEERVKAAQRKKDEEASEKLQGLL
jgi:hypothetical protein